MFWNAKGGRIHIEDTDMDYITFGQGDDVLVMIPGLGDGLTTVKGMALPLAYTYRMYAKNYRVYIFSRKNHLEKYVEKNAEKTMNKDYSTRDMAEDLAFGMQTLGITRAKVLGVSQGGMIAQYLAIDHPKLVNKLVLAVTASEPNETVKKVVGGWIEMAEQGNYKDLMIDTAEKTYSENYLKKYRRFYPLLGKIGKPKSFERFLIQATSCISHNACAELHKITCPVLVIGGDHDKIVGPGSAPGIADKIDGSELFVYPGLGHGAYEEAKDFSGRVQDFLLR